jgi:IPT/TIG domain
VLILEGDAGLGPRKPISTDPNALLGIEPAAGPFSGGQLALLRGNGFSSEVQVWFGETKVAAKDVIALDPNRIQVKVPAGDVGPTDVSTRHGDDAATLRSLTEGYRYESFYVEPSSGPIAGGTLITLTGKDNGWTTETQVAIDLQPCEVRGLRALGAGLQELDCETPTGTPGAKVVTTRASQSEDAAKTSVAGAFTYLASETGFAGGLSGKALTSLLEVTLLDDMFGRPLPGVSVGLGQGTGSAELVSSDDHGVARFKGDLGPTQTVTVAGECLQPITIVDVPVDKLTLYVEPILTPDCLPLDLALPPFIGGGGSAPLLKRVDGNLSWGTGVELKQTSWVNVPMPLSDEERQVAYVFELADDADVTFALPSRVDAVLTDGRGPFGYPFNYYTRSSANITLYAIAGLERGIGNERSFTPYAMGIERGIVPGNEELRPVIDMNIVLDHTVAVEVVNPEQVGGDPDRVNLALALRVGRIGFIPLPTSVRQAALPLAQSVEFRGVPPLIHGLAGSQYVASAEAVSGASEGLPVASVESRATSSSDTPITIDGFIGVPQLLEPSSGETWQGRVIELDAGITGQFDLWSIRIDGAGGALTWRVIAPRDSTRLELPDLELWGASPPKGPIQLRVNAARVRDFEFGRLRQKSFTSSGWTAYSANAFSVQAR